MKSYSRTGKKSKAHCKARVSGKLSDAQLLEKFGVRKCFVELDRLKSDEYGLSEISSSSSSSQKTEKKPIAKNKLKKSNPKHKERGKRKHLDSEIIKNGSQTLHYETLEKHTDHTQLPERNQKTVDLSTKNKVRRHTDSSQHLPSKFSEEHFFENREQAEESNPTEADLARKRRTSNSSRETQNLDSEFSEVRLTGHETAKEIKLADRGKRKNNRTGSSSNSSRETLNSVSECSEAILVGHEQEEKDSQKQARRKKKNRTSIDSKKEVQNLDSECSETMLSSPEQTEESNLTETDFSRINRTGSTSNSSKGTQNFDSEYSEEMHAAHEQADESNQVETQKRKQKRNRSSSNSNRKTQNLDSECSETALTSHKIAEKSSDIQIGRRKRNKSISNSSREMQNLDSESSETVLSNHEQEVESDLTETDLFRKNRTRSSSNTRRGTLNLDSVCSEEILPEPEHFKSDNKTDTRRSRRNNTSSSNSSRETQNLDSEASEAILMNSEQAEESGLTETDLSKKSRIGSVSNSNSETQNFDSECSKTVLAGHRQTEMAETDLSRKNRTRSSSTSSSGSQNFNSECSETVLSSHEQAEIDLSRKNTRSSYSNIEEAQNLESVCCKEILGDHEQSEEVRQAPTSRRKMKRTGSASNSNSGTQNFDSECSKTVLAGHKQTETAETDLSGKNRMRSSSTSSNGSQNFNSECSETVLSNHEQAEIDLSRKNTRSSNSSIEAQNLESVCCKEIHGDHEQSEEVRQAPTRRKKTKSSSRSNRETLNLDHESSEFAAIGHEQVEEISHIQTRSRKRNRSPSDSNKETQNLDSECSETIIVNHEQGVENSLIEIDLIQNRNRSNSGSSRRTENSVSECSEAIFTSAEQTGEICQTLTTVRRRNRTKRSSNSIEGTQNLNSEYFETILASSEEAEVNSVTETDLSEKKISISSSDCSGEIQNLDSEFSGKPDGHTDVQSVVLMSQDNLPVVKRTRNSSSSSNCLLEVQNSNFEEKNDQQLAETQKEKRTNHAPAQKANKKKSILSTTRTTRNSSNASRNKNFHSELLEKHTGHMQTQKINPMQQLNLLAKKRSRSNTQISNFEHAKEHMEPEQTQDVYLDSHLPAKKKAKHSFSFNNSFQNSDSESSEKHNEILQTQELSLDSNLSSKTGSRSPFSLYSKIQTPDFSEKQNEHMQTDENNKTEEDLCMKKSKSISDLDSKIMESALEFPKQNGIEDNLEEQEELENLIESDLHVQEKVETYCSSNEKVSASDSENSCIEDYPAENAKQTFSAANFSLNGKCENSSSENLEKEDFETELERDIDRTDQEDVAMQQSTSQYRARTSSCSSNRSNLSESEILKSSNIEKNMEVQSDLLEKQGQCSTENNVPVLNTTVQETSVENGNSESGFSEIDDAETESESLKKPVEMLGNPTDCETFVQSRSGTYSSSSSRASDSNIKHLELDDDVDDSEKQDYDIESPEISEEESDFSDATLLKKYGIKECSVVLTRTKPFTIHYGRPFLKEVAQDAYRSARKTNVVNLDRLYRRTRLSQFSSLSRETFEREIMKCIRRLHLRDEFISRRLELIDSDEAQLIESKKVLKRKIFYDTNSFVIVNEKHIHEKRKALRNRKFPIVLIEQNEEAEFLARKLMESKRMNIEQNKMDNEKALNQPHNYHDYRETDQYLEVDESGNESDQSENEEANPDTDSSDDDALQSHNPDKTQNSANYLYTRMSKHSLKEGKELQDSNLDCEESHLGRQQLILDSQQDFESGMIQNREDDSNCVNSKPCENLQRLQNQNLLDSNPTLESEHHFSLALHSDSVKEVIADSQWPQVLLYPLEGSVEKDCAKSPLTALSEVDCIPFQQTGDSERTDATSTLKEVAYDESTSECNPPSPGRETPLSVELFDDASEKKSFGTANEEFFVIDEDDDDSEKKSCCSYSEEGSEPDQQLFVPESQESHQNSSLCPS